MLDAPLRLAVGSHKAGSGRGCAMNVISWENGDSTITDFPACSDRFLANLVQRVNDTLCTHSDGNFLCPECSVAVLALGHRTVGTALSWSDADRKRLYVRLALFCARRVERSSAARACNDAVEQYLNDGTPVPTAISRAACDAANAAYAAANAANAYAAAAANAANAYAAANAANAYAAAYIAASAAASYIAASAAVADAVADAYAAADAGTVGVAAKLKFAHAVIDEFVRLTDVTVPAPDEAKTRAALEKMLSR